MPSACHEDVVEILRKNPEAVRALLRARGVAVPKRASPQLKDADFTQRIPIEFRCDLLVLFGAPQPCLAVVIESQLRIDRRKRYSWPVYLTVLRSKFECEAVVLVITLSRSVARWAARPIDLGNGGSMIPLVVGPGTAPRVSDVRIARRFPAMAMLSVLLYGRDKSASELVAAAKQAAGRLDTEQTGYYHEMAYAAFNEAARRALTELMQLPPNYQYKFPPLRAAQRKGKAEGKTEGLANAVLRVLAARKISVPKRLQARILSCSDLEILQTWLDRASVADRVQDVIAD